MPFTRGGIAARADLFDDGRFDSAQTFLPHRVNSSRTQGLISDRRFSWQSSEASIDGQEDEFVDAPEWVRNSSRSSTIDSVKDHDQSYFSYQSEGIQRVANTQPRMEPSKQTLLLSDTERATNLEVALKRVVVMDLELTHEEGMHSPPQHSDWVVSPGEKRHYDILFDRVDATRRGFVAGNDAISFFRMTGLDESHLARIWSLSDIKEAGRLTKDEFALAMHLVRMQQGHTLSVLPNSRPRNFVPPGTRTQVTLPSQPTIPASSYTIRASNSPRAASINTSYDTKCDDCGEPLRDVDFCSACNASFCTQCWDRLVLHRNNMTSAAGIPHEKVKPVVAMKVRKALAPPDNDNLQERLHRDDAVTSWFGNFSFFA